MHTHTGCICLTFLHCVFSNEFLNWLPEKMHSHTGCICSAVYFQMSTQIACIRSCIIALVAFLWLFFIMYFQMSSQMACPKEYIITLFAFVWLFSTVCSQVCFQMACSRWSIITLVAFVWFFPTVYFQMHFQITCLGKCRTTLIAYVWHLTTILISSWIFKIGLAFTGIRFSLIFIHYQQKKISAVSWVILVLNWKMDMKI